MFRLIALLFVGVFLSGCVQITAIPATAHPGDHVVVGLGGVHRNVGSDFNLEPPDLQVTVKDVNGGFHTARVVDTFRAYPDYTSVMTQRALKDGAQTLNLVPYDGGWFAVIKLSDPNDSPLQLPQGNAEISVAAVSPAQLTNTLGPFEGDLGRIQIKILPPYTAGEAENGNYPDQFDGYSPAPDRVAVRVTPADLVGVSSLGGASIVLNYTISGTETGEDILALPASHNPWVQTGSKIYPNGDGTGRVEAYILNPHGFSTSQARQNALLSELQLQFLAVGAALGTVQYQLDTANSYVFDTSGNPVGTVSLELVDASQM